MSFTQYLWKMVLDRLFKGSTFAQPTIYVALSTTNPGPDGGDLTEPTGNNYDRVATAGSDWNYATEEVPVVTTNAEAIVFPVASDAWGTITHVSLLDSMDNVLGSGPLNTPTAIVSGDQPMFDEGDLQIRRTIPDIGAWEYPW